MTMRATKATGAFMGLLLAASFAQGVLGAEALAATRRVPLKAGWRFVKADDPRFGRAPVATNEIERLSSILDRAFRGDFTGAPEVDWAKPGFDDAGWTPVRVPHDWGVMKGDPNLEEEGVGWYRLRFDLSGGTADIGGCKVALPADGKVLFECDGAMSHAFAWINGRFVGGWPYGYTRWRVDLTPHLADGANVLAIRCHNLPGSSRWYAGGGLYRDCRMLVCPKDHVVPGSVRITTPEVTKARATVCVRWEMSVSGRKERTFEVANPRLWDIDDPYLHEVEVEGEIHRYGIRTIAFHADRRGFQLNGRTVPLNGVSMHHDFGVLGAAWNRSAQRRRLALLREMGVNAIRSSHNPPAEGLLELCDEMGFVFMDEVFDDWRRYVPSYERGPNVYTRLFDVWHGRDARAWVRTDRNHPCVILYSLGNEINDLKPWVSPLAESTATARELARIVGEEDPTRPTTNANNAPCNFTNAYAKVQPVFGCNYFGWQYPALVAAHPDVPFFGSETTCSLSDRGEFVFPVVKRAYRKGESTSRYQTSYCWGSCGWKSIDEDWACPPDVQWHWMDKVGTCMGEFPWTGIDYLNGSTVVRHYQGQTGTGLSTHRASPSGFLDLAGFRKDIFYLYQSRYRPDLPMAHILPHWNWAGREGEVTPVCVFTTGDEGELFLNGRSLGRRRKQPGVWDRAYRLTWDDVRYEPGELAAVVYRNGREWARDRVRTTGPAVALKIEVDGAPVAANGEDVAYVNVSVVDARGELVPRAANALAFSLEGAGEIVATENGDTTRTPDLRSPAIVAFNGRAQAVVRPRPGASGSLRVTASSEGLVSASAPVAISRGSADIRKWRSQMAEALVK